MERAGRLAISLHRFISRIRRWRAQDYNKSKRENESTSRGRRFDQSNHFETLYLISHIIFTNMLLFKWGKKTVAPSSAREGGDLHGICHFFVGKHG